MKKTLLLVCMLLLSMLAAQAQDSANVTFKVNMKVQAKKGYFKPATDQVTIPGDFVNWLNEPPANSTKVMDDADADSIYTKVIRLKTGTSYGYKFNIGLGWDGKDESTGNRTVKGPVADSTVEAYFLNEQMPSGAPVNVTFEVDMHLPAKSDASFLTKKVYIGGTFTNWATGALELTDANADSVYTITTPVNSGQLIKYKFIHSAGAASAGTWESIADRESWIPDSNQTIHKFWDDKDPNVTLADGNVYFQIDMSVFSEIGIYDALKDSVRLYGSFNGWGAGGDPSTWRMSQDFSNPLLWTINLPFVKQQVNGVYNYKFFIDIDDAAKAAKWTDGWERPISQGGGNRDVTYKGTANQEEAMFTYDDIKTDYVITGGKNLQVKFKVDMRAAIKSPSIEFTPAKDSLYWISEQPAFTYTQGWKDADTMKVLLMTDADGDSIYEGTMTVKEPSFNSFEYRYGFIHFGTDRAWVMETAGFGDFAYRIRFVGQNAARSFPKNPWTMPVDKWSTADAQVDQESNPYTSLTIVKDNNELVASNYELHQNYPNPFNPSTTIKFSLKTTNHVTLKVFNLLGQEVKTLVNEELVSGSYNVSFNAKSLASGMYLYRLTAGDYVETKRMLLIK